MIILTLLGCLCMSFVQVTEAKGNGTLTVTNRECLAEPKTKELEFPLGICHNRNDSCKHEVVTLSDNRKVMCDTQTEGGGWFVIQKRQNNGVDFVNATWTDYVQGFGTMEDEFWFGLETIHRLCPGKGKPACELRIEVVLDGREAYAKYDLFTLSGGSGNYKLTIANFSGSGNLLEKSNNLEFTTADAPKAAPLCAKEVGGGWWYDKRCSDEGLNGKKKTGTTRISEMKIRRPYQVTKSKKEEEKKTIKQEDWTLMLQRDSGRHLMTDQSWENYEKGWGRCKPHCFVGLTKLHELCSKNCKLMVTMEYEGDTYTANYTTFKVGPNEDKYRATISGYSGDAGDQLTINNLQFSTKDADNDNCACDCAKDAGTGWWFNDKKDGLCHDSLPTSNHAIGNTNKDKGLGWYWKGVTKDLDSLSSIEMKVVPTT